MAEEKVEPRETSWRQLLPWTELFRGFQVALDVNKLALAAVGILVMAFGWWLLAVLFTAGESAVEPDWPGAYVTRNNNDEAVAWKQFKHDRDHWNLMRETAGLGDESNVRVDRYDLLTSYDEYRLYRDAIAAYENSGDQLAKAATARNDALAALKASQDKAAANPDEKTAKDAAVQDAQKKLGEAETALQSLRLGNLVTLLVDEKLSQAHNEARIPEAKARPLAALYLGEPGPVKPYARLATWPWFEDRGPNPYLMATGQLGKPWETGHFWDWLLTQQTPVLLEPIVKLLLPVVYLFSPGADAWCRIYFLCVLLWVGADLVGLRRGDQAAIAAVQVARGEKISALEALNFTRKRLGSYVAAPLIPLAILALLVIGMWLYGYPFMIPIFGDIVVAGLFWPLMIVVGLLLAVTLVGLVGWPFMSVTISAQGGTDVWDAFTRLQLRLPEAVALHLVHRGGRGLRGGRHLLHGFHGVADDLPRQVGRVADAGHFGRRPSAELPVRVRPDLVPLARPAAARGRGGRGASRRLRRPDQSGGLPEVGRPRRFVQGQGQAGVVEPGRRLPGGGLAVHRVSADPGLQLQLLLEGQHHRVSADAVQGGRRGHGRGDAGGRGRGRLRRGAAGGARRRAAAGVKPGATALTMVDAPSLRPPALPPTVAPPVPEGGRLPPGPAWAGAGAARRRRRRGRTEVGAPPERAVAVTTPNQQRRRFLPMGLLGHLRP